MQIIKTWTKTDKWDPTNPGQQPLQYWSAADMGYRSAYWNEQPTTAKDLMGIMPSNPAAQAGVVAGLVAAAYFGYRAYQGKRPIFGFSGPRSARRRRSR